MFLEDFVIGAFSSWAESTVAVHPSPKALACSDYCCREVDDVKQLAIGWVRCEVGMLVVCSNLEKRIALPTWRGGLGNQGFE